MLLFELEYTLSQFRMENSIPPITIPIDSDVLDALDPDALDPDALDPHNVLRDDMTFDVETPSIETLKFHSELQEFISGVIMQHEKSLRRVIEGNFPEKLFELMGTTNPTLISMITEINMDLYNRIFDDIQAGVTNDLVELVLDINKRSTYGVHVLLDKLFRLTFDIHIDISRENLLFYDEKTASMESNSCNEEVLERSIKNQIGILMKNYNFSTCFSRWEGEDSEFPILPPGTKAFTIEIQKNIKARPTPISRQEKRAAQRLDKKALKKSS